MKKLYFTALLFYSINSAFCILAMEVGWTPLHWVASGGDAEAIELLIESGANVNAKDADGETPLHRAASGGHTAAIKILVDNGANVDAKDADDETPLHRAAYYGHTAAIKILIDNGAIAKALPKEVAFLPNVNNQNRISSLKILSLTNVINNLNEYKNYKALVIELIREIIKEQYKKIPATITLEDEDLKDVIYSNIPHTNDIEVNTLKNMKAIVSAHELENNFFNNLKTEILQVASFQDLPEVTKERLEETIIRRFLDQ